MVFRLPAGVLTGAGLLLGIHAAACFTRAELLVAGLTLGLFTALLPRIPALRSSPVLPPVVLLLAAVAGALRVAAPPPALEPGEGVAVAGRVLRWEPRERGILIRLEAHRIGRARLDPPRHLQVWGERSWGDAPRSAWMLVRGRLESNRGATSPGRWADPSLAGFLLPDRFQSPEWGPGRVSLDRVRALLARRAADRLPGFPGRLAQAMLLGRSSSLGPGERSVFRRTGASHLVAVSGLHIGLIALLVGMLTAGLSRTLRSVVILATAVLYAALAGWSPSATRATALLAAGAAGLHCRRPRPPAHWLFLMLPWLLWIDPGLVEAIGFRLSVGAVSGLLFALDLAPRRGRLRWAAPVWVSLGAQWGTLPAALHTFGMLSPFALIPNLVAVPLAGLFLPAVLVAIGLPAGPVSDLGAAAARGLGAAIGAVLARCSEGAPVLTGLRAPEALTLGFLLIPILWFSLPVARRRRPALRAAALALGLVGMVATFVPTPAPRGPWIAFLDVGQGDAAVCRLSDGTVWLIDAGDDRGPGDAATGVILPFLRTTGIRHVDGLVISHRHRDHAGALEALLDGIRVDRVFDAGFGSTGGTSGTIDRWLGTRSLWPCLVARGDTLHAAPGAIVVALHPPRGDPLDAPPGGNLNDASLVIRIADGPMQVLLSGDAEEPAEGVILKTGEALTARILKVGHHGSRTSSSPAFLDAVRPDLAILSVGEGNRFGHPAPITLQAMGDRGIRIYRTDHDGTIWIRYPEGEPVVRTFPPRPRTPAASGCPPGTPLLQSRVFGGEAGS